MTPSAVTRNLPSKAREAGFTLIEVLVALLVLSIGLLGLAMLQLESIKYNTDAYFRTQATVLAYDIIDRMKANSAAANAGNYVAAAKPGTAEDCGDPPNECASVSELASYDLTAWYDALEDALPPAATPSSIARAGNQHTITIRWNERGVPKSRVWVIEL